MNTQPNISEPDAFYAALVKAHEGLSDQQSADLNARLIFLLANQIGQQSVLMQCIEASRACLANGGTPSPQR